MTGIFTSPTRVLKGYLETHFMEEKKITPIEFPTNGVLIKINYSQKVTREQCSKWQKEMFKKYKLEFKEE